MLTKICSHFYHEQIIFWEYIFQLHVFEFFNYCIFHDIATIILEVLCSHCMYKMPQDEHHGKLCLPICLSVCLSVLYPKTFSCSMVRMKYDYDLSTCKCVYSPAEDNRWTMDSQTSPMPYISNSHSAKNVHVHLISPVNYDHSWSIQNNTYIRMHTHTCTQHARTPWFFLSILTKSSGSNICGKETGPLFDNKLVIDLYSP